MSDPQTANNAFAWTSTLSGFVSYLLGFFTAVFAEPFRQRLFRPVLRLSFDDSPDCIARTPIRGAGYQSEGFYFRVRVVNTKSRLARQCRAYLINVEKQNAEGKFERTVYADSIQLAWSCREQGKQRESIDLPNGVTQFVDVISTNSNASNTFSLEIAPFPFRYQELLSAVPKTLRLTVQVSGDGIGPEFIKLILVWKGRWDSATVYAE